MGQGNPASLHKSGIGMLMGARRVNQSGILTEEGTG